MRILSSILLLLGVLSALTLGAISGPAFAEQASQPCHVMEGETGMNMRHMNVGDTGAGSQLPEPASNGAQSMACCVVCVSPTLPKPSEGLPADQQITPAPMPASRLAGLELAPEPGPPRA